MESTSALCARWNSPTAPFAEPPRRRACAPPRCAPRAPRPAPSAPRRPRPSPSARASRAAPTAPPPRGRPPSSRSPRPPRARRRSTAASRARRSCPRARTSRAAPAQPVARVGELAVAAADVVAQLEQLLVLPRELSRRFRNSRSARPRARRVGARRARSSSVLSCAICALELADPAARAAVVDPDCSALRASAAGLLEPEVEAGCGPDALLPARRGGRVGRARARVDSGLSARAGGPAGSGAGSGGSAARATSWIGSGTTPGAPPARAGARARAPARRAGPARARRPTPRRGRRRAAPRACRTLCPAAPARDRRPSGLGADRARRRRGTCDTASSPSPQRVERGVGLGSSSASTSRRRRADGLLARASRGASPIRGVERRDVADQGRPPPRAPCRRRQSSGMSSTSTGIDGSSSTGSPSPTRLSILPSSSSPVIARLSMYSSAWTLSPRCFAKLSGATLDVTSMIGTFASAPFLHFWNTLKPGLVGLLDRDDEQRRRIARPPRARARRRARPRCRTGSGRAARVSGPRNAAIGVDQQDAAVHAPPRSYPARAERLDRGRSAPANCIGDRPHAPGDQVDCTTSSTSSLGVSSLGHEHVADVAPST